VFRGLATRFRCRLAAETGTALVMALSLCGSLAIGGTSIAFYTTSNLGEAGRSKTVQTTYALAEAGINDAYSTLYAAANPMDPGDVPSRTLTINGGTVNYSGTLNANIWTLTGTGTIFNPTGPGTAAVTKTIHAQVQVVTTPLYDLSIWRYLYSDTQVGCMQINNNAIIGAPLYVKGNLCVGNNALDTAPLQVGGTLTMQNNAHVGTVGSPVSEVDVGGGCTNGHNALHACGVGDGIYAQVIHPAVAPVTMPPIDLPGWYQNAMPGPRHPCTTGSFPGGFDNDSTLNRSLVAINLMPASAYDCRVTDGSGNTVGRISWTPGDPGTLVVSGTILFDGNVLLNNNQYAVYQGKATIYVSGTVVFNNNVRLCAVVGCTEAWDTNTNVLMLVAGAPSGIGFQVTNNSVYQGAAYVTSDYDMSNNGVNWGPVVAHQLDIANNAGQTIPLSSLPPGAPSNMSTVTTLQHVSSSWQG
jgi:hypothetical protein